MFAADDMIVNWWNLLGVNKSRVWEGPKIIDFRQDAYADKMLRPKWIWWKSKMGISACQAYHKELARISVQQLSSESEVKFDANIALETYMKNGKGKARCGKGWSDFFYIPGRLVHQYQGVDSIAFHQKLFLEIAVTNILRSLDLETNFENIKGVFLPDIGVGTSSRAFWKTYNRRMTFIHPFKMGMHDFNEVLFQKRVIKFKKKLCYDDT